MRQIAVSTDDSNQRPRDLGRLGRVVLMAALLVIAANATSNLRADETGQPPAGPATQPAGPKLPPGFEAPPPRPAVLDIEKEILPETADADFKKIQTKYNTAMRSGDMNQQKLVTQGLEYRILRMADKANRDSLHTRRGEIIRDIRQCGRLQPNQNQAAKFKKFVLDEAVRISTQLLDNNFYVRLNAVILLSELNVADGNAVKRTPAVPFTPAFDPLLTVVTDPEQPEAVKIAAVRGVSRIARDGELDNASRVRVGKGLTDELKKRDANGWYQARLAEALGNVDIVRIAVDGVARPLIAETLMDVVIDPKRHWIVRSQAASSLGRIPLDGQINIDVIAYKVAELCWQLSNGFHNSPREFYWTNCFVNVYLAFKPMNQADQARDGGLLTKVNQPTFAGQKAAVEAAYERIRPLAAAMTAQDPRAPRPLPRASWTALRKYIAESAPEKLSLEQGGAELKIPGSAMNAIDDRKSQSVASGN